MEMLLRDHVSEAVKDVESAAGDRFDQLNVGIPTEIIFQYHPKNLHFSHLRDRRLMKRGFTA